MVVHPTAAVAGITWRTTTDPVVDKAYSVTEIRKTLPDAYAAWTDMERKQLTAEVEAGLPWKEIARSHGRGAAGVGSEAKKLGLVDDQHPPRFTRVGPPKTIGTRRGGGAWSGRVYSILADLPKLCRAHSNWMFTATSDEPPFEKGTT